MPSVIGCTPTACAASSTISRECLRASATMGSMSQTIPYIWTGMIARVLGVMQGSIWCACTCGGVSRSTSQKIGVAPVISTALAEPKNVKSGTMTSSPRPTSAACKARIERERPIRREAGIFHIHERAELLEKGLALWSFGQPIGIKAVGDARKLPARRPSADIAGPCPSCAERQKSAAGHAGKHSAVMEDAGF